MVSQNLVSLQEVFGLIIINPLNSEVRPVIQGVF